MSCANAPGAASPPSPRPRWRAHWEAGTRWSATASPARRRCRRRSVRRRPPAAPEAGPQGPMRARRSPPSALPEPASPTQPEGSWTGCGAVVPARAQRSPRQRCRRPHRHRRISPIRHRQLLRLWSRAPPPRKQPHRLRLRVNPHQFRSLLPRRPTSRSPGRRTRSRTSCQPPPRPSPGPRRFQPSPSPAASRPSRTMTRRRRSIPRSLVRRSAPPVPSW